MGRPIPEQANSAIITLVAPPLTGKYWVCVITKNGAETIGPTLDSILTQTLPPELIVIVDDGSVDDTHAVVESRSKSTRTRVQLINLPDRGYDIRRVPANINSAYAYVKENCGPLNYSMISGDDCIFPPEYSAFLLSKMGRDSELVIASGDWGISPSPDWIKAPQGAGRFVEENFWREAGGKYPVAYGWESWLLFKALELGYRIANFTGLRYVHMRPSGTAHKFSHWGTAMRTLGYHPLFVLLRFAKNVIQNAEPISIRGNVGMLANYFLPQLHRNDPYFEYYDEGLRSFVKQQQLQRLLRYPRLRRFRALAAALWKVSESI